MAEMNLAFGVGIAVGVFVVLCGVARLWWSRRTARWPRVIGEVRSTTVVKPAGTGQYGSRRHTLNVGYTYVVAGKRYFGDVKNFGGADDAHALASRCERGSAIGVYYHPKRPGISVLESHVDYLGLFIVVAGLLLVALAFTG
jgi:hypothetical protein